jgi:hypothetical protein
MSIPTIACVMRTGGIYTPKYVYNLRDAINRHTSLKHNFVCLSDTPIPSVTTIPLIHKWRGWWSKIELFRPNLFPGPVITMDLDALIVGDILPLFYCSDQMTMVKERGRNPNYFSSSCMAWTGDYSFVYENFKKSPEKYMEQFKRMPYIGDQAYISKELTDNKVKVRTFCQVLGYLPVVSYKRDCTKDGRIPKHPQACFINLGGKPKPHQFTEGWVYETWNGTKPKAVEPKPEPTKPTVSSVKRWRPRD